MNNLKTIAKVAVASQSVAETRRNEINESPLLRKLMESDHIDELKLLKDLGYKTKSALKTAIYRLETELMLQIYNDLQFAQDLDIRINSKATIVKLIAVSLGQLKVGNRDLSVKVIQRALYYAKKYEFSDLIIICLQKLCFHYSMNQIDLKKYKELSTDLAYYNEVHYHETKLNLDYTYVTSIILQFSGKMSENYIKEIQPIVQRMTEIARVYPTRPNILYCYDAQFGYLSQLGDYQKVIDHSEQFLELLTRVYPDEKLHLFTVKKNLALSHLQIGNNEKAGTLLEECISMISLGAKYWIYTTSMYFLALVRCNRINEAIDLTIHVMSTKKMVNLNLFDEAWKIRHACIQLMMESKFISLSPTQKKSLKKFSISKFVNDVPIYSKDKLGQNINILFLHIGFLLLNRKYGMIIDRNDALQQYSYRYFKKSKYARAQCFLNIILSVIKANFHPVRTRNYCAPYIKKLNTLTMIIDENEPQFEIIPYGLLTEIFLHIIDTNASIRNH
jgi:hypothetical protein